MLKDFSATMTAPFDPTGKQPTAIQFYYGPNKFSTLRESSNLAIDPDNDLELEEIIYFGWPIVRWINRYFIMYLFDGLSSLGLNMGIVLILLTLIVKAIIYPFTKKSYISSAKMRALKPYVDEINKKYPKQEDALKKQQETMALYSKYGASPMGGCLPMLIQMPVFIALFNFVPNSIELRQQSFLWASDLSAYDAIISWDANIWPIGNHLSLFCLLFCVTQILNTYYMSKMQPSMGGSPEMEQQQKMMRWMMYVMPVMFFFMFNEYSSGLNFYYFISTLFSVLIYVFLRNTVNEDALLKKMEAYAEKNKNNPAKQTNIMSRLEALQEKQKELIEERDRIKNDRKNKK
jgi:YidC/Oxa1 family membrane protein insertase